MPGHFDKRASAFVFVGNLNLHHAHVWSHFVGPASTVLDNIANASLTQSKGERFKERRLMLQSPLWNVLQRIQLCSFWTVSSANRVGMLSQALGIRRDLHWGTS